MNRVNEQQVRRLDEMDQPEARQFLAGLLSRLDPEEEYGARHPEDYVLEMPQSGERFRGRENVRAFQEAYPANRGKTPPPSVRLRRVLVREGLWVAEGVADYDGAGELELVMISELRDGKMWRDRWYFAEPFETPEWRSRWVERMEPGDTPDELAAGKLRTTDEDEVRRLMEQQFAMMRAGDFADAHEWYDEAVVGEWPQSGERIRGKKNLLALRQAYPAGVEFEVRRLIPRQDLGVSEYVIRYDGRPVHVVAIAEFADGEVVRETHYFAEPFEAPEWRSQWVEMMEERDDGSN